MLYAVEQLVWSRGVFRLRLQEDPVSGARQCGCATRAPGPEHVASADFLLSFLQAKMTGMEQGPP